jgi:hypothetical protein
LVRVDAHKPKPTVSYFIIALDALVMEDNVSHAFTYFKGNETLIVLGDMLQQQ